MNKHTPGPWIVCVVDGEDRGYFSIEQDREALGGDEPSTIGEVYTSGEGIDMADGEANAALIAASPDMLAALQGIIRSAAYESGQAEPSLRELTVGIKYLDAARAAIAKAEGGAE